MSLDLFCFFSKADPAEFRKPSGPLFLLDLNDLQKLLVISALTTALGTEIDFDLRNASGSYPYRLDSLKNHDSGASRTGDIFFHD